MLNKFTVSILIFAISLLPHITNGQLIENKLNVYVGYATGFFHGAEYVVDGDFRFPSFYNNLQNLNGFDIYSSYKISSHFSLGLSVNKIKGSNWSMDYDKEYSGASVSTITFSPLIQYHSQFKNDGIYNRLKLLIGIAPNFGSSSVTLDENIFDIEGEIGEDETQYSSSSPLFGIQGSLGIEFDINLNIGIYAKYSLSHNLINSPLNADERFSNSQFVFGIYKRLIKNKRYFY